MSRHSVHIARGAAAHSPSRRAAAGFPMAPMARMLQLAFASGVLALAGWQADAHAQATPAAQAPRQAADAVRRYDIPAGSLSSVLARFANESGVLVAGAGALAQGKTSPGVSGTYGVQAALNALLAGTGLAALPGSGGAYELREIPASPSGEVARLEAVTVAGNQLGEITEGTGLYTSGKVATATRLVLSPRETPQSLSVVTRQHIDDFSLNSIDDALRHTPGLSVRAYDSERSDYMARGFSVNNFQYDGIPMRRVATYSAGQTLSDMVIYDRVEVLKGATGLLTGTGAPGASINLIRKKPTREFQGSLGVGVGSWDTYRSEVDLSGALTESGKVRGRVAAAYQDKHSHLNHYQKKTSVFYGVLEFDLTPDTLLTVGADYQNNDPTGSSWAGIRIYDSHGNFNRMPRSFNNGARWSSWQQESKAVFATLEHYFSNDWVAKVQFNRQINGYDAPLSSPGAGYPDPVTGYGTSLWANKYVGQYQSNAVDAYASGPFTLLGRTHELVVGLSMLRQHWKSTSYAAPSDYNKIVDDYYAWTGDIPEPDWVFSRNYDEVTRERGIYATGRFSITGDLKLILGGRVSDYRAPTVTKNGVVTPYAGIVYDINENFAVYGSYTSIFSPQTLKDEQGKVLDPLEGKNYEIGLKGEFFGGRLNGSLALFKVDQDNYAVATGNRAPDGTNAYRATQGVVTKGFEAELSGQIAPRWQVMAGFAHKIARRDGNKVTTVEPENQFKVFVTHKPSGDLHKWTFGGGARWQSKSWASLVNPVRGTEDFTQKSYWVFDAMAAYQFNKNLSATLNVRNLFDKRYYTIMEYYSTYTWGEPRSVFLNVKYKF